MKRIIVHASDLHIGKAIPDRLAAFLAHVSATMPDLVVLTGDLVDAGKRSEISELEAFLRALEAPVLLTAGNHDAPTRSLTLRVVDPFRRLQRLRGYEPEARLGQDAAIVALRTAAAIQPRGDWSLGDAPRSRVGAAVHRLNAAPARWRLAACHHALIDPPNATVLARTINGPQAHAQFEQAGVDILLCGHGHKSFIGPASPDARMWTSLAPTLSSPRARDGPQGFHLLELADDAATVSLIEWSGLAFAHARSERFTPHNKRSALAEGAPGVV